VPNLRAAVAHLDATSVSSGAIPTVRFNSEPWLECSSCRVRLSIAMKVVVRISLKLKGISGEQEEGENDDDPLHFDSL
jgi:hypothetical protein